jgi:hypothetical protein
MRDVTDEILSMYKMVEKKVHDDPKLVHLERHIPMDVVTLLYLDRLTNVLEQIWRCLADIREEGIG